MTPYGLVASLAWSGVAVYLARVADKTIRQWLSERILRSGDEFRRGTTETQGKLERAKLKAENRLEIARLALPPTVARSTPMGKDIILPDDLEAHVMQWGDEWARDDERGNIRARYLEFHNGDPAATWQKVRRAVGIGEMP